MPPICQALFPSCCGLFLASTVVDTLATQKSTLCNTLVNLYGYKTVIFAVGEGLAIYTTINTNLCDLVGWGLSIKSSKRNFIWSSYHETLWLKPWLYFYCRWCRVCVTQGLAGGKRKLSDLEVYALQQEGRILCAKFPQWEKLHTPLFWYENTLVLGRLRKQGINQNKIKQWPLPSPIGADNCQGRQSSFSTPHAIILSCPGPLDPETFGSLLDVLYSCIFGYYNCVSPPRVWQLEVEYLFSNKPGGYQHFLASDLSNKRICRTQKLIFTFTFTLILIRQKILQNLQLCVTSTHNLTNES